jgi:hypothetical protein
VLDVCFDYKDPNVVSQIKEAAKDNLAYAFDCISEKESTKQVCAALTGHNSHVATVLPVPSSEIPVDIKEHSVLMYTIFEREVNVFRKVFKARPQGKKFAEKLYILLSDVLLSSGLVKPNSVTKIPGGLNWSIRWLKRPNTVT